MHLQRFSRWGRLGSQLRWGKLTGTLNLSRKFSQTNHTEATKISNETLQTLPSHVIVPTYDRKSVTPGIVHIGLGNFHRAHQAWYLQQLMQQGEALDWGIIGAGVRPFDETQRLKLASQDYLTTLIELDPKRRSVEIMGPMIDYVPVEEGNGPLIEQMSDPAIRIVSLTVTEGGYYVDPATKMFDAHHPDILHDAAQVNTPKTAFGAMIAALKQRREAGSSPFTCQSCDNLQGNGHIMRKTLVSLAKLSDPELAHWIDTTCSFPNAMVDCIVPATGPNEIALAQELGIDDAVPVTHENFRQWVIEDDFCGGRPAWEKVGATITNHVHPYETMKIRILNGGHQIIANLGELLSVSTISACMEHPLIGPLFRKVALEEIVPHVQPVPGMTPVQYVELIHQRFSNPQIADTVRRVAFDGSSRHPGFLIPTIRDAIGKNMPLEGLALSQALWARMCEGSREDGSLIRANDPLWDDLQKTAKAAKEDPIIWLKQDRFYGDLAHDATFAASFERWLSMIWCDGAQNAVESYL